MKEFNIGLIGSGTIGGGVVKILQKNQKVIEKRTGVKLNLKKVCDLKENKELGLDSSIYTKNYDDLLVDDIDIIVELIGGYSPAKEFILKALEAKKHVVTANKAVVAKYGKELFDAAKNNNVQLAFEAAVGGCIPIIKTIKESYAADNIKEIYGILNGTTNYILTKMESGQEYKDALKKAQKLGFAEADPTFDVEGMDAAQKITILSELAFNTLIEDDILTEGITKISKNDMEYADELGYKIKLLAIGKQDKDQLELRVHPTMIPKNHELATVNNELNAVYVVADQTQKSMLYGRGAGELPTATVVLGDVIDIAKGKNDVFSFDDAKIKDSNEISSRYYLRLQVVDKPGVLAKISKVLGDNKISIAGVQQKEVDKEIVPLIMTTHEAVEEDLNNALKEIKKLDIVKEDAIVIRIEDLS